MCWEVNIKIKLQNDTEARRADFSVLPDFGDLICEGDFPNYSISNGYCGCSAVADNDLGIDSSVENIIEFFMRHQNVKRVEIEWHWFDDCPKINNEVKISLSDFLTRNRASSLKSSTRYRITDYSKYKR